MLPLGARKKRFLFAAVADYVGFFEFHTKHCGLREGSARCKRAFTVGLKMALGQTDPSRNVRGFPKGFPRMLGRLVTWLRGPAECKRVALTILSSYRLMEADPKYEFKSIFNPPASRWDCARLLQKEARVLKLHSKKMKLRTYDPSQEVILSSGPYGSECSMECALAAGSLLSKTKELRAVLDLWKATGTSWVSGLRFILNSACSDWPSLFARRFGIDDPSQFARKFRFSDSALDACSFMKLYVGIQYRKPFFSENHPLRVAYDKGELEELLSSIADRVTEDEFRGFKSWLEKAGKIPEGGHQKPEFTSEELNRVLVKVAQGVHGPNLGSSYLSRLTFVPKEGGGSRPVTPTNIFVQSALTPIHDFFMDITSKQRGDCTFDESIVSPILSEVTRRGQPSYSFDWSNATDFVSLSHNLYPIVFEYLGKSIAKSWYTLMKSEIAMPYGGRPFKDSVRFTPLTPFLEFLKEQDTPSPNKTRWNLFRYAKGAPMGLRSLWPVFATFHHCFRALADRLATQAPGKYLDVPDDIFDVGPGVRVLFGEPGPDGMLHLLREPRYGKTLAKDRSLCHRKPSLTKGDDQWLLGRKRSYIYLVLCHVCGFEISQSKSVVYREGFPNAAEFSKRYFVSGKEITPVSAKAVREAVTSRNALHLYEVSSQVIAFYDDSTEYKKITIAKAASLAFRQILGPLRTAEFGVWASCPIHLGRYDDFLSRTGLNLFPWPPAPDTLFRSLLSKYLRERLSRPVKDVIALLRVFDTEKYGVALRDDSVVVHPLSPLLTSLEDTEDFIPQEFKSLVGLISKLGSFDEVDYLVGRTPYARVLEQITRLSESLKRLRGMKRRMIRFDLSRGPVRELFTKLSGMVPISSCSEEAFAVFLKWTGTIRGKGFLLYPTRGP